MHKIYMNTWYIIMVLHNTYLQIYENMVIFIHQEKVLCNTYKI